MIESENNGSTDAIGVETPGPRDHRGRFGRGNAFSRGKGRPRSTVTEALRARLDPERLAEILTEMIEDSDTSARERLKAVELAYAYLDGRPVTRTISARLGTPELLPPHWQALDPTTLRRELEALRRRGATGELALMDAIDADSSEAHDEGDDE